MRDFLNGLELDKETIETIMYEVGKRHTGLKEQAEEYKAKCSEYEKQISQLNSTIEENNKSLENLKNLTDENTNLKADIQLNKSNVKSEFSDFVRSEVLSRVNDETDFTTALNDYKKNSPQYFGDTVVKKVQSSPSLNTGETMPHTTNEIMNDILRGAVN